MPRRRKTGGDGASSVGDGASSVGESNHGADEAASEAAASRSQGGEGGGDEDERSAKRSAESDEDAGSTKRPAESDQEEGNDEEDEEDVDEDEEEEVRQQAKIPEPLNRSRGAGTTAKVKKGDFILPHVDDADLANENEDVSLTVFGQDGADDELAMEQARTKSNVYFESGSNRVFQRKRTGKGDKGTSRADARSDKDEQFLKTFLDALASFIASSFIFCQGLLGGASLLLLYFSGNQSEGEILRSYSPIADDTQKAFLFLSSFSLIGAFDKYSKDHMAAWFNRSSSQRAVDTTLIALYFSCLVCTLVCTPMDDMMFASHLRSPEYYRWDLGEPFLLNLQRWKVAHILRCLCGLLGWVASSWETRNYLNNAPNKPLHDLYEQIFGTGPQG